MTISHRQLLGLVVAAIIFMGVSAGWGMPGGGLAMMAEPTRVPPTAMVLEFTITPDVPVPTPTDTPAPTSTPAPPTPTPTVTPLPTAVQARHELRPGDTLLALAINYGITLEELLTMNNLTKDAQIRAGDSLIVPSSIKVSLPPATLLVDSEAIYGRAYVGWDTASFIAARGGYLAAYREGERSAAEIIDSVAAKYRVGPRLLLTTIEMLSGWVTNPTPSNPSPFAIPGGGEAPNLSWQAAWAAKKAMEGYYGQLEGRRDWVTLDSGELARLTPGTNPGTASVANLLAAIVPASNYPTVLQSSVFPDTYRRLFGEAPGGPVIPPDGVQPYLELPFPEEELWYFTGGPHGGFGDTVSGWAALDFAPPQAMGCWPSKYPVRAMSSGLVIKSAPGEVMVDLDGDGDERTGWVLFYMHLGTDGRIPLGATVHTGDVMGYPSCEGGVAEASHLHIARLYDGQWMSAVGAVPFQLGRWTATPTYGPSYDGKLVSSIGGTLESCNCRAASKNRFPERPNHRGP